MERYLETIESYDDVTTEDLVDMYNQLVEKVNYILNAIYNNSVDLKNPFWGRF